MLMWWGFSFSKPHKAIGADQPCFGWWRGSPCQLAYKQFLHHRRLSKRKSDEWGLASGLDLTWEQGDVVFEMSFVLKTNFHIVFFFITVIKALFKLAATKMLSFATAQGIDRYIALKQYDSEDNDTSLVIAK